MKKTILCLLAFCSMLSAAPQAIVFDFGDVLTTKPNTEEIRQFLRTSFYLNKEEFNKVNQLKFDLIKQRKTTDQEFWLQYAKDHNIDLPHDWLQEFIKIKTTVVVDPKMYDLIAKLKETNLPIALLSNINPTQAQFSKDSGFFEPFDPCLLSCELGMEKPDPKIFDYLIHKLELPAKDILFIDDRPENVDAAKNQGIDAILFKSQAQLVQELQKRGLLNSVN